MSLTFVRFRMAAFIFSFLFMSVSLIPLFADWQAPLEQDVVDIFNLAQLAPEAPVSIQGKTRTNESAVQIDRLHIITFTPSKDVTVTFYRLRRNGVIIAEIPGIGPYKYIDHHRRKGKSDVYTLTSVNAEGLESAPLTVTLN